MLKSVVSSLVFMLISIPVFAADVTYRKDVLPLWKTKCMTCHGAQSPYLGEFKENKEMYKQKMQGPRMDSYADLIFYVGWPDTGAIMRRLDDGSNTTNGKPGNMYQYLGSTNEERQANLGVFRAWVGEEAWILKRWDKRGDFPGVTKEELSTMKLKY